MDKLYIDCNILIDWLTDRFPFSIYAEKLISVIEKKKVAAFVSPLTLANAYYIVQKHNNKKLADEFLKDCLTLFNIIDITGSTTIKAIKERYKDFEDDLHYYTALKSNLDYIITRNKKDFPVQNLKIATAEEYIIEKQII